VYTFKFLAISLVNTDRTRCNIFHKTLRSIFFHLSLPFGKSTNFNGFVFFFFQVFKSTRLRDRNFTVKSRKNNTISCVVPKKKPRFRVGCDGTCSERAIVYHLRRIEKKDMGWSTETPPLSGVHQGSVHIAMSLGSLTGFLYLH